jgi:hypothetical protein
MTPMTLSSHSDVFLANAARPTLRERVSDQCIPTTEIPGSAGQRSFAYFHIRKLARRLINDPSRLAQWWDCDRIDELGALTPAQLLASGQHAQLEAFLCDRIARRHG